VEQIKKINSIMWCFKWINPPLPTDFRTVRPSRRWLCPAIREGRGFVLVFNVFCFKNV